VAAARRGLRFSNWRNNGASVSDVLRHHKKAAQDLHPDRRDDRRVAVWVVIINSNPDDEERIRECSELLTSQTLNQLLDRVLTNPFPDPTQRDPLTSPCLRHPGRRPTAMLESPRQSGSPKHLADPGSGGERLAENVAPARGELRQQGEPVATDDRVSVLHWDPVRTSETVDLQGTRRGVDAE
jgi:hypothetical protein